MLCLMLIIVSLIYGRNSQMVEVFPKPFAYGMAAGNITIYFNASWREVPTLLKITRTEEPYLVGSIRWIHENCIFSTEVSDTFVVIGICESQKLTGKLEIYDINEYDHKQNITFEVVITGHHIITTSTTIFVVVPVEEVIISSTDIIISSDKPWKNISCSASSRPSANITWFITSLKAEKQQIQSNITYETDFKLTKSVLSFHGKKEYNGNTIHCEAKTVGSHQRISSSKATITVYYGPEQNIFLNSNIRNIEMKEKSQVNVSCFADCNPICYYRWILAGIVQSDSSYLILESITLDKSGQYTCEAFNEFDNQTHTETKSIILLVLATEGKDSLWEKWNILIISSLFILAALLGIIAVVVICKKCNHFKKEENDLPKKKRNQKNTNAGSTNRDGKQRLYKKKQGPQNGDEYHEIEEITVEMMTETGDKKENRKEVIIYENNCRELELQSDRPYEDLKPPEEELFNEFLYDGVQNLKRETTEAEIHVQ